MAKLVLGIGEILGSIGAIGGKTIGAITNTSLLDILDGDDTPTSISDADGTRGDENNLPTGIVRRGPRFFGNLPGSDISPVNPYDPAGDGFEPIRAPESQTRPQLPESSQTYTGNNQREQNARQDQRARRIRRIREKERVESKESNDIPMAPPPRGTLLPYEDDDFDIDDDPNETDEERTSRRRRSDILRRGQQAGITLVGGTSGGAIYNTWKNRSKWVLKNSGTTQQRQYPPPPSMPSSGGPSDLDPSQNPPEDPIYPAQPNPIEPTNRSNASCIRPVDDFQRAVILQNVNENAMDCRCD
jgi:hypothetical protein